MFAACCDNKARLFFFYLRRLPVLPFLKLRCRPLQYLRKLFVVLWLCQKI